MLALIFRAFSEDAAWEYLNGIVHNIKHWRLESEEETDEDDN